MKSKDLKYLLICLLFSISVYAQKTEIKGRVFDAETGESLPYVNVAFKNSKTGTTTDLSGNYSISTYYATDTLVASFVGYLPMRKKVKKDASQVIDFALPIW